MMTAPGNASERAQNLGSSPAPSRTPLSPRETECLVRAANGWTDGAIAIDLILTKHTVKSHLKAAYTKLDVPGRIEAFIALGWLKPPAIEAAA